MIGKSNFFLTLALSSVLLLTTFMLNFVTLLFLFYLDNPGEWIQNV